MKRLRGDDSWQEESKREAGCENTEQNRTDQEVDQRGRGKLVARNNGHQAVDTLGLGNVDSHGFLRICDTLALHQHCASSAFDLDNISRLSLLRDRILPYFVSQSIPSACACL